MNEPDAEKRGQVLRLVPFFPKSVFRSEDLFQGKREIIIEHAKEHYRLLITKSGKLILNK